MGYRICLISPTYPPDFGWDPLSRYSLELAMSLKEKGHDVGIVSYGRISDNETECTENQMPVLRIPYKSSTSSDLLSLIQETTPLTRLILTTCVEFWKGYFKFNSQHNFEVIIAPDYMPSALLPALAGNSAYLIVNHKDSPDFLKEKMSATGSSSFALDQGFTSYLKDFNTHLADGFIFDRKSDEKTHATQFQQTIPFTIDTDHFSENGVIGLPTQGKKAVAISSKADSASSKEFLKAVIAKLKQNDPDAYITLILDNLLVEDLEADVKKKLAAEGIEVDSLINSKLIRNLMPAIWRAHQIVLILPSLEAGAYSFIEPMACGLAAIAGKTDWSGTFIADGKNGVVLTDASAEGFANAASKLLDDDAKLKELGKAARQVIVETYSRHANSALFDAAVKKAMESRQTKEGMGRRAKAIAAMLERGSELAKLYQQLLYDFLFLRSIRFKLRHWVRRLSKTSDRS